jgi:hypothetical protein
MKNKLEDLNNHLFDMVERIMDEDLTDKEEIAKMAIKSQMLCNVTIQMLNAGKLAAAGYELFDGSFGKKKLPSFFREEGDDENETKTENNAPLLHFKREKVSKEGDNRALLLRSTKAL